MKIQRLNLEDFGILQNQVLNNISPGIVVIAGQNRAGKTVLLKALRYLGYGFPASKLLPPPSVKYLVSADVNWKNKRRSIKIEGYSKPRVYEGGREVDNGIEEMFSGVDSFTYQQLYTISLDELCRIPEGVEKKEQRNLAAVLLGAGWEDALNAVNIKKKLEAEAEKIGGKHGSPGVKLFKNSFNKIKEGLKAREEANSQLEEYLTKKKEADKLAKEHIPQCSSELKNENNRLELIQVLKDYYDSYVELYTTEKMLNKHENKNLLYEFPEWGFSEAEKLRKRYETVVDEYEAAAVDFKAKTGVEADSSLPDKLLEAAEEIKRNEYQLSGWRERVKNYFSVKEKCERKRELLKKDIRELYGTSVKDISFIEYLDIEEMNLQELYHIVDAYKNSKNKYQEKDEEISTIEVEIHEKEKYLTKLDVPDGSYIKKLFIAAGADILLVALLSLFILPIVGVIAGAAGIVPVLAYYFFKNNEYKSWRVKYDSVLSDINELKQRRQAAQRLQKQVNEDIVKNEKKLVEIKENFDCGILDNIKHEFLPEFIKQLREFKQRYEALSSEEAELDREYQLLKEELVQAERNIESTGMEVSEALDIVGAADNIFKAVEESGTYLGLAQRLAASKNKKEKIESEIVDLLEEDYFFAEDLSLHGSTELKRELQKFINRGIRFEKLKEKREKKESIEQALKLALRGNREELIFYFAEEEIEKCSVLEAFKKLCSRYCSKEEIKKEYETVSSSFLEKEKELQELKEKKQDIEYRLNELKSDEKLFQAQKDIDEGREEMAVLAEEYAEKRLAAFMLDKVYERLLKDTENSLLAPACEAFNKMTKREYTSIKPPDTFDSMDFKAQLRDGQVQDLDMLSRATREQLFLAVRLSRIKEVEAKLPAILDDTFANFDPVHLEKAVQFLSELGKAHQVFVLTCHSHLVRYIDKNIDGVQYWCLDRGVFSGPYGESGEVEKFLH